MTDASPHDAKDDPLERTELVRRLRRMEWPPAPSEVKQRVLDRIAAETGRELDGNGSSPPPPPASE